MVRPRKADRPIKQRISIPESLHNKVELLLFSPLEGRVPQGAWSSFVTELIRLAFERAEQTQAPVEAACPSTVSQP